MRKRQLAALFLCSVIPYTVGNGALPLLPVYATQLGAPAAVTGMYLSFCYLAIATGSVLAGWLSDRLQRRKALLILVSAAGTPVTWLIGRATNMAFLTLSTGALWFLGGMGLALTSILAGLSAGPEERGKVFGILALASTLATLIGGLGCGPIVDRWGFPALFAALAVLMALWSLSALLLKETPPVEARPGETSTVGQAPGLSRPFRFLLSTSLLSTAAFFISSLGRSLAMDARGFAATAISSTGAIGAAATLPLPPLIGWLSDRMERRVLLGASYLLSLSGIMLLRTSSSLWHFGVAVTLSSISGAISGAVAPALVADLVSRESLGKGMSLSSAASQIGGIVGFAGMGYAIQQFGLPSALLAGGLLPLGAAILLVPTRKRPG
jgi:MFS family permease